MVRESDRLSVLKGVGPKKEAALREMGLATVGDLLSYYPRTYKDRGKLTSISSAAQGQKALIRAVCAGEGRTLYYQKRFSRTEIPFAEGDTAFRVVYYNQPYRKNFFLPQKEYLLFGTVSRENGALSFLSPAAEAAQEAGYLTEGLYASYRLPQKCALTPKQFSACLQDALSRLECQEDMPPWVREELGLCGRHEALWAIHFPSGQKELEMGLRYQKTLDFLRFHVLVKGQRASLRRGPGAVLKEGRLKEFIAGFGFSLTQAQQSALGEIQADLERGVQMNRLLQGDVGSGKTAVAVCAAFLAAEGGRQAVITAPTEILAKQHHQKYKELFASFGFSCALLYSSMGKKEREETLEAIRSGQAAVIFGTHAVFSRDVQYKKLGLIVIDEQQRYGVAQRAALEAKGENPHVLVMSATPIPRTLALSLYQDLDLSVIGAMPKGRVPIKTYLADGGMEKRLYAFVRKHAEAGEKCYIVCPAIDDEDMENVAAVYRRAAKELRPHKVLCLTGDMKNGEKDRVMRQFAQGDGMVLVATSVIEVGVDVPQATLIWIKGSERFGLSQLHQLRGRVGRGALASCCVLQTDSTSEATQKRLTALTRTNDGFAIAREDLKLRGAGDLLGQRQSGRESTLLDDAMQFEELFLKADRCAEKLMISNEKEDIEFMHMLHRDAKRALGGIVMN